MIKIKLTLLFILASTFVKSQNTVGLLYQDANTTEGYTLFSPELNNSVYLINNCGQLVNEWTFNEKPGATCYLLENGNLLRAGKDSLQIRDWNNNVVWTYATTDNGLPQHHDIEPLPNGNILCIITDTYTPEEAIAAGRDPDNVDVTFKIDKIVEIEPIGTDEANVVWEWKFMDHIIQDIDNTKPNFGVVSEHPELLDINFVGVHIADYTHCNAIDYNANLDQILISSRHMDEIYIIDHSTTTTEAAGSSGGNSNQGGNILWRWGNPQVYNRGTAEDQKLFKQHDAKWVQEGYLDFGKISVFSNGDDSTPDYSSIHLIEPEFLSNEYTMETEIFKPLDFDWSWNGSILGVVVNQSIKSGVQSLPNGNMLICETLLGRISEINKNGVYLWSYINPSADIIYSQFSIPTSNSVRVFRAEKYPLDYVGFTGIDLTPFGYIEDSNILSDACALTVGIEDVTNKTTIVNPVRNGIIQFNETVLFTQLSIIDFNGRQVLNRSNFSGNYLEVNLSSGMYFLKVTNAHRTEVVKLIIN